MPHRAHTLLLWLSILAGALQAAEQNPRYQLPPTHDTSDFLTCVAQRVDNCADDLVEALRTWDANESYKQYALSDAQIDQLGEELDTLPERMKAYFNFVLRLSFIDQYEASGFACPINESSPYAFMILNPLILKEDLSAFLTRKENSWFRSREGVRVEVVASREVPASIGITLHELGHIMNYTAKAGTGETVRSDSLQAKLRLKDLWKDFNQPHEPFFQEQKIHFYSLEPAEYSTEQLIAIYRRLEASNYPSLYATVDEGEDFAELNVFYWLDEHYGIDVELRLLQGEQELLSFSLSKREKVRTRLQNYASIIGGGK